MTETVLWACLAALLFVGLVVLVGRLLTVRLPASVRSRWRGRHYRIAARNWAARRLASRLAQDAQRFRNAQARFQSCMRRPKGGPPA